VLLTLQLSAETDQLPEDEGPVVVPLDGAGEGAMLTGDVVYGDVGRRRWLLMWGQQLLRWAHGWCSTTDQGEGVFPRALWCARSLGERQCQTIALAVFKACMEVCLL
jgi:hypothetical protein